MEKICLALIIFKSIYTLLAVSLSTIAYRALLHAAPGTRRLWQLLTAICICDAIAASAWISNTLYKADIFEGHYYIIVSIVAYRRIGWIVTCFEYLLITMFLEELIKKTFYKTLYRLFTWISAIFPIVGIFLIACLNATKIQVAERTIEYMLYGYVHYYVIGTLILLLLYSWYSSKRGDLPRIVRQQLTIFSSCFVLPHLLSILLATNYHTITVLRSIAPEKYYWIMLNDIIFALAFIYTIRRLLNASSMKENL